LIWSTINSVKSVNVHEAKTNFPKLLAKVERGEEILIARAGKPVARLVGIKPQASVPTLGADLGVFAVPDDFDAPLPDEVIARFEGGEPR
jgi:prevent-host-death family protein